MASNEPALQRISRKTYAYSLIVNSSIGLLFSLALIVGLLITRPKLVNSVKEVYQFAGIAVGSAQSSLDLISDTFTELDTAFNSVFTTMDSLKTSLDKLPDFFSNTSSLIGDDLSKLALNGESALKAAAEGSKLIDNTLGFLNQIPLLGIRYEPKQPLSESLTELSKQMGGFPEVLQNIKTSLEDAELDLGKVTGDLGGFSTNLDAIDNKLSETKPILSSLQTQITELQTKIDEGSRRTVRGINWASAILVLLCLWWFSSQLLMLYQGLIISRSGKITIEEASFTAKDEPSDINHRFE